MRVPSSQVEGTTDAAAALGVRAGASKLAAMDLHNNHQRKSPTLVVEDERVA